MLPKYLHIHGYRSYIDAKISFQDFGNLFCLIGENGAGKSSIIEMITTALYYRNSCTDNKGTGMETLINHNCDYFELRFCFEMNGNDYLIVSKKFKKGGRELYFYINGINQSEKILETQQKINDVIKLDYDVFLDTVCVGQGMSSRFMAKKPNERKETLAQILDIKKYEQYEKEAKEQRKDIKSKIDEIQTKLDFISSQNEDEQALCEFILHKQQENDTLNSQLSLLQQTLEEELKAKIAYQESVSKTRMILSQRQQLYDKINDITAKINDVNDSILHISVDKRDFETLIMEYQVKIDKKRADILELKEQLSALKTKKAFLEKEQNAIQQKHQQLHTYNSSICDFCGNIITPEHKEQHLQQLQQEIQDIARQLIDIEESMQSLRQRGNACSIEGKELSRQQNLLQQQKEQAINQQHKKEKLVQELQYLEQSLTDYQKQYQENIAIEINDIANRQFNDITLKQQIHKITEEVSDNNQHIAVTTSKLEQVRYNKKLTDSLRNQLTTLTAQLNDYDSVIIAFGKKGIQKNIIKQDLPNIEKEINDVLQLLSDNAMSVRFRTNKTNKKETDTLDVVVSDGNEIRNYETYSGGEKFRIDFACHIGLAKFLTKRAGATIDFFIIDEGLGSQDLAARQKFINILHKVSTIFKQVMCITHIQELQDAFSSKVLITKDPLRGSELKIL